MERVPEGKRGAPVPIDIFREEGVLLNFLAPVCAEPLGGVTLQQSRHDAPRLRGHIEWEVQGIGQDALIHRVDILIVKRRKPGLQENQYHRT
jgi:hypothetical protein